MRFRSLDCHGPDEAARKFAVANPNTRRFDATFDCQNADAPRSNARLDGTDADAPRSNDEFRLGASTL
jgi:hypothetical protein